MLVHYVDNELGAVRVLTSNHYQIERNSEPDILVKKSEYLPNLNHLKL
jgi:hypothetical protein